MSLRKSITCLLIGIFFMIGCQESDSGAKVSAGGTSMIAKSGSGADLSSVSDAQNKLLLSEDLLAEGNSHAAVLDDTVILKWTLPGDQFEVTTLDHESRKVIKKENVKGDTYLISSLPYGKKYEFHVKDIYSNEVILLFAETGNDFVQTSVSDISYYEDGITLTWNAVPYASKYNLYYSENGDTNYNFLKEVSSTSIKFDDISFFQDENEDKILFFAVEAIPIENRVESFIYEDDIYEDDICEDDTCEEPALIRLNYIQPNSASTKSSNTIIIINKRRHSRVPVKVFSVNTNLTRIFFSWSIVPYVEGYEIRNSNEKFGTYQLFQSNITGTSYTANNLTKDRPYFAIYPIFKDAITGEMFYGSRSQPGEMILPPKIIWGCARGATGAGELSVNITNFSEYKPGSVKLFCDTERNRSFKFNTTITQSLSNLTFDIEEAICYVTGLKYYDVKSDEFTCSSSSYFPPSEFTLSVSSTGKAGGEFDNTIIFNWGLNQADSINIDGYSYSLKVVDNNDTSKVLVDIRQETFIYRTSILSCNVTYKSTLNIYPNSTTETPTERIEKTFTYDCDEGEVTILNEVSRKFSY